MIRSLVLREVEAYLSRYKTDILSEFPRAHPFIETTFFLNKVNLSFLRDAGLLSEEGSPKMALLHEVQKNVIGEFKLVEREGYQNNGIYATICFLLKDYR